MVNEMLERMTTEEKEQACKALMDALGIKKEMPKLDKHCPMCGGDLVIEETVDERTHIARCTKCGITGMVGIRGDDEDLPTKGTLEYRKKKYEEAMREMAEFMDDCMGVDRDCQSYNEEEDDSDDEEEDDDEYSKPDYKYTPKKKCSCRDKGKDKIPPFDELIGLMKTLRNMLED